MIRERFLRRPVWEAKLRRWGCEPAPANVHSILRTAEVWTGPRGTFTVPLEAHDCCDFWAIQRFAMWYGEPPPDPSEAD